MLVHTLGEESKSSRLSEESEVCACLHCTGALENPVWLAITTAAVIVVDAVVNDVFVDVDVVVIDVVVDVSIVSAADTVRYAVDVFHTINVVFCMVVAVGCVVMVDFIVVGTKRHGIGCEGSTSWIRWDGRQWWWDWCPSGR